MSEHDVPAERGRDELRERLATTLAALVALRDVVRDSGKLNGMEYDELGVEVNRAIEKAEAALASQETREPDGWAIRMRDGSWRSTIYADRATAERMAVKAREFDSIDVLPVYLGAPAKAMACPCGGGPGHGDAWCGDYECPTCGRGPKQEEAIFQAGLERGRADMAPAEATEASAPEGATWGDVRSGLRAELIAEGIPVTEATRLARKVVHRFTAAEATKRSESLRRVRTAEWWGGRLDDIAVLRAGLNARGIDGTDAQIAEAYAMWSDKFYAAGWVSVGDTAPPSFVGWAEREWLAPEPSGPYRLTGAAIRNRRTAAGMSLRELAAAVGISNVEMGEIERGIRRPDANTVTAIRNAIEASRCGLPSPVRGYGPCILRRGHSGPGAHQHGETGRILQAYHAPDTSEEGAHD